MTDDSPLSTRQPNEPFGVRKQSRFIEAYRQTSNIRASCEHANIHRSTFYNYTEVGGLYYDADFAERVKVAEQEAIDRLEAKAWNNALQKDSETSLWNLLKAHRKQKYGDKGTRNLNVAITADELANLTDEQLDKLIAALASGTGAET